MSGEPSSSLVTTGQLDWVALSRAPISFTLEAISRISKAGVELVTVSVGRAICSTFSFGPEGQKEVTNSLSGLQGTGAFAKGLWFGFGVKSVASTLSETEQGACCVALCSALSMPYDSFRVAEIWREMSKQVNAPDIFTPSIHQWSNLVKACSGTLANSHFPLIFDHFFRLLVPDREATYSHVAPSVLAEALLILAKLSNGCMANAVFVGERECALLAAIATCLFRLRIEILDENQALLFANDNIQPEVTFIRESEKMSGFTKSKLISRKAYFVSSGRAILKDSYLDGQRSAPSGLFTTPSKWSTLFQDAFPEWLSLWSPVTAEFLTMLLRDAAKDPVQRSETSIDSQFLTPDGLTSEPNTSSPYQYNHLHSLRTSFDFVRHARDTFPELSAITPDAGGVLSTPGSIQDAIVLLNRAYSQEKVKKIVYIAQTVIEVVRLLSPVRVYGGLCPSALAVRDLKREYRGKQTHLESLLWLFVETASAIEDEVTLAVSSRGICVFSAILEDLEQIPTEALVIQVMPGHIQYNNHNYSSIRRSDQPRYGEGDDNTRSLMESVQMVIEESDNPNSLGVYYQLRFREDRFNVLALDETMITLRTKLVKDKYPRDTSRNVSTWMLIRNRGLPVHTQHGDNSQVHQHRWCIAQTTLKNYFIPPDLWEATILALKMPMLYLAAANRRVWDMIQHQSKFRKLEQWGVIICMCCCHSCVKQLTHDVLQSLDLIDTISTVKWQVISMQSDGNVTDSQLEFQRVLDTTLDINTDIET